MAFYTVNMGDNNKKKEKIQFIMYLIVAIILPCICLFYYIRFSYIISLIAFVISSVSFIIILLSFILFMKREK